MATIQDVADKVGVSRSTVSGAFSGKKRISAAKREEIFRVAHELRYEPNLLAQRLGTKGGHEMISLLASPDFSLETRTSQYLVHQLEKRGFEVDCCAPPYYVAGAEERQIALFNRVRRLKPRAIILSLVVEASAGLLDELRRYVMEGGILVGYAYGEVPSFGDWVVFDRYRSTYDAIKFLLEQGHRKIGYHAHADTISEGDSRLEAMRDALAEYGLEVRPDWLWSFCCYEEAGAKLAKAFLKCQDRPTALQIINDYTASAFVNELFRAGVRVPNDVSVIGNEDSPVAATALVPLTTTSFPYEEISNHVIGLLCARLEGDNQAPRVQHVRGQLIHRESVLAAPIEL